MRVPPEALPLFRASVLSIVVFVISVAGYAVLVGDRHSLLDIVYMTVITLATIGYGEIVDTANDPVARVFTMLVILLGVGSIMYMLSSLAALFSSGDIQRLMWMRKMKRKASSQDGHVIVCGGGTIGTQVLDELTTTQRDFVLIEADEARVRELHEREDTNFPAIIGDATEDAQLKEAGIDRAAGVISCLRTDNDNMLVVVSARMLRPDVRIVTRCSDTALADKLRRAGADSVVSPNAIGGMRLSSEMIRPQVVSFLDHMLHDREQPLRVEEWRVDPGTRFAEATVGDVRALGLEGYLLIALADEADRWQFNPDDAEPIPEGTRLIFMSTPEAYQRFADLAR